MVPKWCGALIHRYVKLVKETFDQLGCSVDNGVNVFLGDIVRRHDLDVIAIGAVSRARPRIQMNAVGLSET